MKPLLLLGAALALASCLDHELPPDEVGPGHAFIALQRDFAPLEQWTQLDAGDTPLQGHPPGKRVLHVNRMPSASAMEFPVGTIIAKSVEEGPATSWLIHAMVKRGGEYNLRGAVGWEWFELRLDEARTPIIVWRGETPPNGERYGCLAGTCEDAPDCNQCHASASANDFVMASELKLGSR